MQPCIFCGGPADSKEDLFPRWVLKRVQNRDKLRRQVGNAPPEITDDQEVRLPCVCQTCNNTWMSGMEQTVKKFMGPMIDDFYVPLDHQYQQNLAEWAVKCAMCNDTVGVHTRRFFTEAECSAFRQKRTIPDRTQVFAAQYIGRGLDSNGADFVLTEPGTGSLLARGYVYNVLVGHVVLQMLSWRPEAQHADKKVQIKPVSGPWDKLTIQIWPIVDKSVDWPPEISLTAHVGVTHYGHFRERFKNGTGHRLVTLKSNSTRSR